MQRFENGQGLVSYGLVLGLFILLLCCAVGALVQFGVIKWWIVPLGAGVLFTVGYIVRLLEDRFS